MPKQEMMLALPPHWMYLELNGTYFILYGTGCTGG